MENDSRSEITSVGKHSPWSIGINLPSLLSMLSWFLSVLPYRISRSVIFWKSWILKIASLLSPWTYHFWFGMNCCNDPFVYLFSQSPLMSIQRTIVVGGTPPNPSSSLSLGKSNKYASTSLLAFSAFLQQPFSSSSKIQGTYFVQLTKSIYV